MVASNNVVSIYAHRGFWFGRFPENSREAFAYATQQGFRSECDVWMSADGQPIVMHDETPDRTTTGTGPVVEYSMSQLQRFKCRIGKQEFSPPPVLSEVADDLGLVEIKPASVELVKTVIRTMVSRKWMLQSFDAANIRAAEQIDPELPIAFLVEDEAGIRIGIDDGWRIHLDHALLDNRLAKILRDADLPFGAWTVNTEPDIKRVLDHGVSAIISDHPDLVRKVAQQLGFACQ